MSCSCLRVGELQWTGVRRKCDACGPGCAIPQAVRRYVLLKDLYVGIRGERLHELIRIADAGDHERRSERLAMQQQGVADATHSAGRDDALTHDGHSLCTSGPQRV